MIEDKLERMRIKIDFFTRNSIPVHISTFQHGWFNGWISKVTDDLITIDEYVKGNKDIFIVDIKDIVAFEPPIFTNEKEGEDGNKRN